MKTAACSARANDLMALSRERIAIEVKGLLGLADPVKRAARLGLLERLRSAVHQVADFSRIEG